MTALLATTDDRIMWDALFSLYQLPVLSVADEIGIFASLSNTSKSADELAVELKVDARALLIHLSVLAAMHFVERRDGRWQATVAARMWLHPESEGYFGAAFGGFRQSEPLHQQLLATLQTGDRATAHMSAVDEWERGEMPAELAKNVTAYMNAHSFAAAKAVAQQSLFGGIKNVLDVGGGSGIFSIALAKAWPQLRASVLDIGVVCKEAETYIVAAKATEQVTTIDVNMFTQDWPHGFDAHFLSNVFHDWSDTTCRLLAKKSFAALPSGGKIILHEMLMNDDGCGPLTTACFSLLMLLGTKGKQYTVAEFKLTLEEAGFVDVNAIKIGSAYYSLVTARKP
jgi:3-hydroxy-5-methyl-1-naphthoate 3-O-methyltransferase